MKNLLRKVWLKIMNKDPFVKGQFYYMTIDKPHWEKTKWFIIRYDRKAPFKNDEGIYNILGPCLHEREDYGIYFKTDEELSMLSLDRTYRLATTEEIELLSLYIKLYHEVIGTEH